MLRSESVRSLVLGTLVLALGVLGGRDLRGQSLPANGPLRANPNNPRYFTDGSGKAVYLTGSHVWSNLKDFGQTDPPQAFNYTAYLDFLSQRNHNFIRLWTWEAFWEKGIAAAFEPGAVPGASFTRYVTPSPWLRTGPGAALDGKAKFNLNQLNQAYFDRLRSRVIAARDRGIYVSVMLFEGCSVRYNWYGPGVEWRGNPFHASNNVNGINGDPNNDGRGVEIATMALPAVLNLQKAYIRKVIGTVGDLDNVLYEVANEHGAYSRDWQYHLCTYVKDYEAGRIDGVVRKRHPVGITDMYSNNDSISPFPAGTNQDLFNSPADWVSPRIGYNDNMPASTGPKVVILDTDHVPEVVFDGDRRWVWKAFARGHNPIYMDVKGTYWEGHPIWEGKQLPNQDPARNAMGHTRRYANRMNLVAMTPRGDLTSTGYALSSPGSEYLVYAPNGGTFTVNLNAGTYALEWFNTAAGTVAGTGTFTAPAGLRSFTVPFAGDAALYLKAGRTPPPPPPTGGNGTGLKGEYFDNLDFTSLKVTRTDATVNFDWGTGSPNAAVGADTFSVRWTGQVEPPASGTYTFTTVSDDGVRLWVNNQLLINNWTLHAPTENSGSIVLTGGQRVPVKMEFYENGGGAVAKLLWTGPGIAKQVVPQGRLYPAATAPPPPPPGSWSVTLEAENMPTRIRGRAIPGGWQIWGTGEYIEQTVTFPEAANYRFDIVAKGPFLGGAWPLMELRIDQAPRATIQVDSTGWKTFSVAIPVAAGSHRVAIAFMNDYFTPPANDRNLEVDKIAISK